MRKKLMQRLTLSLMLGGYMFTALPAWAANPTFTAGTGTNSTIAGVNSTASGRNSLAVGYQNIASGSFYAVAIGSGSESDEDSQNIASGSYYALAVGSGNIASGNYYASTFGYKNKASGTYGNIAIGINNEANSSYYAISIGNDNKAYENYASAFGTGNEASGKYASAFGSRNEASGNYASAFGTGNEASGNYASAFGQSNNASGTNSVAFGYNNNASAWEAVAVGTGNTASHAGASAFGYQSTASKSASLALGYCAEATLQNSVAIGSDSSTGFIAPSPVNFTYMGKQLEFAGNDEELSIFSVGSWIAKRRITNVAAGNINSDSTDAVNGSQLWSIADCINSRIDEVIAAMPVVEAGNNTVVDGDSADNGSGSTDVVKKNYTVSAWDTSVKAASGENNIIVTSNVDAIGMVKDYSISLNKNLEVDSFTATDIQADNAVIDNIQTKTIQVGDNVKINDKGMSITGGPSVTTDGIDADDKKITNVAAGTDPTDAVNVSQLTNAENDLSGQINHLSHRINKVGAGAAALASMHPLDYDPHNKLSFSAGLGTYHSQTAASVGMFYRPSERVMFNIGGTVGNAENMFGVGINFALDRRVKADNGIEFPALGKAAQIALQDKVQKLEYENAEIKADNASLKSKLEAQDAKIAKLEQMMQALVKK